MKRLGKHPNPDVEALLTELDGDDDWETSQADAQVRAKCLKCQDDFYFHEVVEQAIPASRRRIQLRDHPCVDLKGD